jgi:hypothetical protein
LQICTARPRRITAARFLRLALRPQPFEREKRRRIIRISAADQGSEVMTSDTAFIRPTRSDFSLMKGGPNCRASPP